MEILWIRICIFCMIFLETFHLFLVSSTLRGNEIDTLSLLAFKERVTHDPLGILSTWNRSMHVCKWSGVTCGHRHRRVTMLDLQSLQLVGGLSPHIGNLSFLKVLYLQNNSFNGSIPQNLGYLFRLQQLDFENNTFTGNIPANISGCSNLVYINLGGNKLTGEVPAELGSLSKVQTLWFYKNNLAGELPSSFGNLSSLYDLSGAENYLHGHIPCSFGKLRKLTSFVMGSNGLTGNVPPSMYNLSLMTLFSVPVNQLEGSLPSSIGYLFPNLEILEIYQNQFSGPVPITISNLSNLLELELSINNFSGKVPRSLLEGLSNLSFLNLGSNKLGSGENDDLNFLSHLVNKSNLDYVDISDNNFGGVLPEYVSNFSKKVTWLRLGRNRIRGNIPKAISNLINLVAFSMQKSRLTGSIPSSFGHLKNLVYLYLNENELSGSIPSSFGNFTSLEKMDLGLNNLQGTIPSSLGKCQNLLFLFLEGNLLSGGIPREVLSISSLSEGLLLSDNQLTGSIPVDVGYLVHLAILDVSNNRLSGKVPGSLSSCTSMESLYMEGNFFQGPIPSSFASLRAIQVLDLSRNKISGQIPEFLGDLKLLQNLNLSFNDLEGEVPKKGAFTNASRVSLAGNSKLCGGIYELRLPTCPLRHSKKRGNLWWKLVIYVVFGSLFLIVGSCMIYFYLLRKTKSISSSTPFLVGSLLQVSYESLLKATDGFSSRNLLGTGSFGSVYKGVLDPDGTTVAVKVLNLRHRGALKSFIAECETLRLIRHRNLVKIITACSSIDFTGNDFKALVYEFMVNGSLEEWLHPNLLVHEAPRRFSLLQRLNVAIDIGCALDYLHNHCETPIVHCDVKPSNVLLDDELTGCVRDFGLAKFLSNAMQNDSSSQSSSIGVRGTIGYAPPEYGIGNEISAHGDIYSYGILLLEMFTGKRPTEDLFGAGFTLHDFVKTKFPDRLQEITEPILMQEAETEETSTKQTGYTSRVCNQKRELECLISIFGIELACSSEIPRDRMNMTDVVARLISIRVNFISSGMLQVEQNSGA